MATNPIGPTGPHDGDDGQVVPTTGGAAAQPKKEDIGPTGPHTEGVEAQPIREIGPTGPRKA